MRHWAARKRLSQLLDGTLAVPEEREVRAHLVRCAACRLRLAEFEACERLLARLPGGVLPFASSAAGEQRLAGLARWSFERPARARAGPGVAAFATAAAAVACVVAIAGTSSWVPRAETTAGTATQVAYVVPGAFRAR
jgi:anti-sigma factor RsiW